MANMHFENMDLKMTLHVSCFDVLGTQITSTEFGLADAEDDSLGSKMASATTHTLMGMGTIFIVLIFISCIISLLKYIPKLLSILGGGKNKKDEGNADEPAVTVEKEITDKKDDTELIAVISAAIAASEHTSTDSFVVRSIRRR